MDINQFLNDANTLMQQIAAATSKTLAIGTAIGKIVEQGRQLLVVLIARFKSQPGPDQPAPTGEVDVALLGESGPITTKSEVAIVVDITRRALVDVGRFLDEKQIDADLIIVTNDPAYGAQVKFVDPKKPEEWEEIAREFNLALGKIKRVVGGAKLHIFLAAPLPLAFALGCLMGTVDEGTIVYHWEGGTYWPVVTISRQLRQ